LDYGFKITTHGRAVMISCSVLGVLLNLTRAAVGSGKVGEMVNLADVHQLVHYEDEGTVGERHHEGNQFFLTVQYSNKDRSSEPFSLGEFMVFAKDPVTGEETDFLYATLGDYQQQIPGNSKEVPVSTWEFPLIIVISDELEVNISASPGLVRWDDMMNAIKVHNAAEDAHPYIRSYYSRLDSRVALLELMYNTDVSGNPFTVTFDTLVGVDVNGVWNVPMARIEF